MGCACTRAECHKIEYWRQASLGAGGFHSDYSLTGQRLGAGAFGTVYAARSTLTGEDVAVKVVDLRAPDADGVRSEERQRRAIKSEIASLRAAPRSVNIVEFRGSYIDGGLAYIVMERCSMGLYDALRRMPVLTESRLKPIFVDMLGALAACHAAGIVHRDVKCDNFLVGCRPDGKGLAVKLCDFGLACRVSEPFAEELVGVCGTAPYMAPEMLKGARYGAKVDIWALGALAHVLLLGRWPYAVAARTASCMKAAIVLGSSAPDFNGESGLAGLSGECAEWVRMLLRRDPSRRPGAKEALTARCFRRHWQATQTLEAALSSAARCGAFQGHPRESAFRQELDDVVFQFNAKPHGGSEASTAMGTDES